MGEALAALDGSDLEPGPPPLPLEAERLSPAANDAAATSEAVEEITRRTVVDEAGANEAGTNEAVAGAARTGQEWTAEGASDPEGLEATRRTVEPANAAFGEESGELAPPPLPTARVSAPPPPERLADRARATWARQPRRRRRWIVILLLVGLLLQIIAQGNARWVVRELRSEAAPDVEEALDRYRFAASMRPFDLGLGSARLALEKALVSEAERLIARFRGDTPTAVRRDWQAARNHLEAALELGRPDDKVRARLLYAQAQLDRIDAGSLRDEGREQQAERKWDDALFGFRRAAELDTEWPDPYLGLSRVYAYEQLDLEKLEQSLRAALSRGYPRGSRERAQIADAHSALGMRALGEAANLRGQRAERQRLYEAQRHFELAVIGYEQILSFGNARKNRDSVLRRLKEILERLREIRRI